MKPTLCALAAGACLTALVAVGITAYPALAGESDAGFWDGPDWRSRLTESERRAAELARSEDVILRRTAMRTETVTDVIAGRIAVDEAVRRFVCLNQMSADSLRRVRETYRGRTDEERAGWQLVAHLRARHDPRADALVDGLVCRLSSTAETGGQAEAFATCPSVAAPGWPARSPSPDPSGSTGRPGR